MVYAIQQGCKSLLRIGGIIGNFTPILPYFQRWGDDPRPLFFSGEQIKWRPKKKRKRSSKNGTHFPPNSSGDLRSGAHPSQIFGGDADEDHTWIIGGTQSNYWGGYILHPPRVSAPLLFIVIGLSKTRSNLLVFNVVILISLKGSREINRF